MPPRTDIRELESICVSAFQKEKPNTYGSTSRPGVPEVPWGPALEQKMRSFTGKASPLASTVPPPSQQPRQRDKELLCEQAPAGAAPSHFPLPSQHSIFIYRYHLDREAGLAFPGQQPCLLKSEFHLACAKWELQG